MNTKKQHSRFCKQQAYPALRVCLFLMLGVSLAGMTTGCGGSGNRLPTAKASGVVLYDNAPLNGGSLLFVPVAGGPSAQAMINSDGTFVVGTYTQSDGAVPGEYQVSVTPGPDPSEEGKLPEDLALSGGAKSLVIPEKYRSLTASGLTASIKANEANVLKFELVP